MNIPTTKKTPVAELGGDRDEGLKNTPNKEMNMMESTAITPAQYCKAKREHDRIDLYELAHGTVLELLEVAFRTSMDPSVLVRLVEEDQL